MNAIFEGRMFFSEEKAEARPAGTKRLLFLRLL